MDKIPFPSWVDSTILETFKTCEKMAYWQFLRHLKTKNNSNEDLRSGGAFAQGLEVARNLFYVGGKSEEEATARGMEALWKDYGLTTEEEDKGKKSWKATTKAFLSYLSAFPLATEPFPPMLLNGRAAVEFTFSIPLPRTRHPESGEPIMFSGKCDVVSQPKDTTYIIDEKTTSRIGPGWAQKWHLRAQFISYIWALQQYNFPAKGVIVRGIPIGLADSNPMEAIIMAQDWKISMWLEMAINTVNSMISAWKVGYWSPNLGYACTRCQFVRLCDSPDPEPWIASYYMPYHWNPLTKELHERH